MNWHRIRNYLTRSQAEQTNPSTPREAEELDAVDRLYAAAARIEPRLGFRAAVRRQLATSRPTTATELIRFSIGRLSRPLLAGATGIAIILMALTVFWSGRSQVHAAPVVVCEIKGMICQGCARQVSEILSRVPGVRSAQVDAKTARARVVLEPGTAVPLKQLSAALDETKVFHISDVSVTMEAEQP